MWSKRDALTMKSETQNQKHKRTKIAPKEPKPYTVYRLQSHYPLLFRKTETKIESKHRRNEKLDKLLVRWKKRRRGKVWTTISLKHKRKYKPKRRVAVETCSEYVRLLLTKPTKTHTKGVKNGKEFSWISEEVAEEVMKKLEQKCWVEWALIIDGSEDGHLKKRPDVN